MSSSTYFIFTVITLMVIPMGSQAQCFGTDLFPLSTTIPDDTGVPTTISDISEAGDYFLVDLIAGRTYRFTSSISSDHITVSNDQASGALSFGTQPLYFVPSTTHAYYVHLHRDAACGTQNVTRTTQVTRAYCSAGSDHCGSGDQSIVQVAVGTINNSTMCGVNGYSNFSALNTEAVLGQTLLVTVTNGKPTAGDKVHAFVDWNNDFDLASVGEIFTLNSTDNITFSGNISIPTGSTLGNRRLRIRLSNGGSTNPCGNTVNGEVEDYTLIVKALGAGRFAGGTGRGDAFRSIDAIASTQFSGGGGRGDIYDAIAGLGQAQFLGGSGRGDTYYAFGGTAQAQFAGGIGRGDTYIAVNGVGASQFNGGIGRGDALYAFDGIAQAQYMGGQGRGDVASVIDGIAAVQFAGGIGRGDIAYSFVPVQAPQLHFAVRSVLEGPYDNSTGLMNDALRSLVDFPLTEPFTALGYGHLTGGGETIIPSVLSSTGADAIVDWVLLELRDPTAPTQIIETQSALIQRDGDVVATDGVSPVTFKASPATYHLAILHRTHLGIMTLNGTAFSNAINFLDFSESSTNTFGVDAQKSLTGAFPTRAMWTGDVGFDGTLKYVGSNNDRDPILVAIGGSVPTITTTGYLNADVNLDGLVRYVGVANDRDPILVNIGGSVPTNTRQAQLP